MCNNFRTLQIYDGDISNLLYYNMIKFNVFIGFGGRRKDDTWTVSNKECGQARSKTTSWRKSGYANGYKYRPMLGSYAWYSCI